MMTCLVDVLPVAPMNADTNVSHLASVLGILRFKPLEQCGRAMWVANQVPIQIEWILNCRLPRALHFKSNEGHAHA